MLSQHSSWCIWEPPYFLSGRDSLIMMLLNTVTYLERILWVLEKMRMFPFPKKKNKNKMTKMNWNSYIQLAKLYFHAGEYLVWVKVHVVYVYVYFIFNLQCKKIGLVIKLRTREPQEIRSCQWSYWLEAQGRVDIVSSVD